MRMLKRTKLSIIALLVTVSVIAVFAILNKTKPQSTYIPEVIIPEVTYEPRFYPEPLTNSYPERQEQTELLLQNQVALENQNNLPSQDGLPAETKAKLHAILKYYTTPHKDREPLSRELKPPVTALKNILKDAYQHKDEILAIFKDYLGDDSTAKLTDLHLLHSLEDISRDLYYLLGLTWGAEYPEEYATHLQDEGMTDTAQVLGWFSSQLKKNGKYEKGMLDRYGFSVDQGSFYTMVRAFFSRRPLTALDAVLIGPTDNTKRYEHMLRRYAYSAIHRNDQELVNWLETNKYKLPPDFFESIQKTRLQILEHKRVRDKVGEITRESGYQAAADYLVSHKADTDGRVYDDRVYKIMDDWTREDPEAAITWFNANLEHIDDPFSLVAPMFRVWGEEKPDAAFQAATMIENSTQRAFAMSNIIIVNAESDPGRVADEYIMDMPQDFVKARSIAGFLLGSSRHYEDKTLERITKSQFVANEFNFEELTSAINDSSLPDDVAQRAKDLINSY
ncbi:hypothetical protein BVX97_03270 [bacterium E08(2017)]|nr:hypothetical protein BVX97_03270 [bacterium E08(2017)]